MQTQLETGEISMKLRKSRQDNAPQSLLERTTKVIVQRKRSNMMRPTFA